MLMEFSRLIFSSYHVKLVFNHLFNISINDGIKRSIIISIKKLGSILLFNHSSTVHTNIYANSISSFAEDGPISTFSRGITRFPRTRYRLALNNNQSSRGLPFANPVPSTHLDPTVRNLNLLSSNLSLEKKLLGIKSGLRTGVANKRHKEASLRSSDSLELRLIIGLAARRKREESNDKHTRNKSKTNNILHCYIFLYFI